MIEHSLSQTYKAVTPVIQTARWTESWWMKRHNVILEKNRTGKTELIFRGNGGDYCQIDERQKETDQWETRTLRTIIQFIHLRRS